MWGLLVTTVLAFVYRLRGKPVPATLEARRGAEGDERAWDQMV